VGLVGRQRHLWDSVNTAARLQALAEPGAICVSASVREQIGNKLACRFEEFPAAARGISATRSGCFGYAWADA
jgi:class 3 adenylate cyclase